MAEDAGRPGYLHDDLMTEYYHLADTVAAFDQRPLTIKSWGVTFSLVTLAVGFQQDHYGLFLVAAAGALGFWFIEGSTKSHQVRYYPRMGDIEETAYERYGEHTAHGIASSPLIDWGWHTAAQRIWGLQPKRFQGFARVRGGRRSRQDPIEKDPRVPQRWPDVKPDPGAFDRILLWPHVALPHAIAVALGLVLFVLGLAGVFGPI
ncbi:MAG TPA: hypothetical protein VFD59_15460 [Nocardioidaceae bacterium]|nr:hypothetical protein [Nocardioidaceae bacterium]